MSTKQRQDWPVLREYDRDHLMRIALPLGGIGTGTVALGGRGDLRDWEIVNRPAKGFIPPGIGLPPCFVLYAQAAGGEATTRLLEGPLPLEAYESSHGSQLGQPRFRDCSFAAAYPFGQVHLSDPGVPLEVCLQAFNPLIPADAEASGIPVAVLRYILHNPGSKPVSAAVCGILPNFIGADGSQQTPGWCGQTTPAGMKTNRNRFQQGKHVRGIFMDSEGVDPAAEQWGTLALTTTAETGITYRTGWIELGWGDAKLDFWDDFSANGELEERDEGKRDNPTASLAVKLEVPAKAVRAVTFLLTWHFPNRQTWTPAPEEEGEKACACACACNTIGNYYTTQYKDAWDVAEKVVPKLPELEAETLTFVDAFCESDLPATVKEAALFNLSTLRTQTCFRTPDGRFFGFEGCGDTEGCCLGSCTHVWNYEQACAFLFGDLAKTMREVEFAHATDENGLMSFRVHLPLERACESGHAAADGQMGCVMKLYRDWQLSGDKAMLEALWPKARKALEFCWIEGGWDADKDGVMEGCQHNTMDVEYYGPNPQMGTWYLGALRAAEEMARYLGEADFADTCRTLFERGSKWLDANLFNGEYYEHEIRPVKCADDIAKGLRLSMGTATPEDPAMQLGAGCLVDQLVGQYMAHVLGLGYLLDRSKVRNTLRSLMKYNFRRDFRDHFNNMRSFVLGDESAMLMATYPKGRRPKRPFPYFNEVMTGFEYSTAVHMLYEGQTEDGLEVIAAIRERYDGRKRSPFDEAECGHHYARAMASWGAVLALTGFRWSGVEQALEFGDHEGCHFWANGSAWGTCQLRQLDSGVKAELTVLHGTLTLKCFTVTEVGQADIDQPLTLDAGQTKTWTITQ